MKLSAKILVVGGGPAGAIAAKSLAERGSEVILLERNLSFEKPCGGGIPSSAFDELAIPKEVIKREVKSIRIVSPIGEQLDIELKGGSLAIVTRGEFDRVLRHEAEKRGAQVIEGAFRGLIIDGKKYKVEAIIKGVKTDIVAEYIIAADGVNSRVRAALGIRPAKSFFTLSEKIRGINTDYCEFWFGLSHAPGFYSWIFPAADGISAGTGSSEPGKVLALFKIFREKKGITQQGLKMIYKIPMWKGDLYNKNNIIFAGDSAGQVMPLSYEGIYYAMKAGEFAASAIIQGRATDYERMWKSRFQKRFSLMDKLRSYFLKNDVTVERLVALHRRFEVQEASMRLWMRKDSSREGLKSYIKLFGKFLC
ncbi:MAG TPA: geranylgeranyl reductase family protein [Thermodesulfovibrionales bacterium]|nr:geranylgeranyl reductase family protein [Thermodesulfovibrionales bacterium]